MFNSIGKKIKILTEVIFVIEVISSVITGSLFVVMSSGGTEYRILMIFIFFIAVPLAAWIVLFFLYGYGELIDKTDENARNTAEILEILKNGGNNGQGSEQIFSGESGAYGRSSGYASRPVNGYENHMPRQNAAQGANYGNNATYDHAKSASLKEAEEYLQMLKSRRTVTVTWLVLTPIASFLGLLVMYAAALPMDFSWIIFICGLIVMAVLIWQLFNLNKEITEINNQIETLKIKNQ